MVSLFSYLLQNARDAIHIHVNIIGTDPTQSALQLNPLLSLLNLGILNAISKRRSCGAFYIAQDRQAKQHFTLQLEQRKVTLAFHTLFYL